MECYSCRSLSGEQRVSPGPAIYEGQYWVLEHAYPVRMKGWLVLVLKRHAEALHELSREEFSELAELQAQTSQFLRRQLDCEKEYSICLAEAPHFNHIHFHMIAKPADLPDNMKGSAIFAMVKPGEGYLPPEEIKQFCEELKAAYSSFKF